MPGCGEIRIVGTPRLFVVPQQNGFQLPQDPQDDQAEDSQSPARDHADGFLAGIFHEKRRERATDGEKEAGESDSAARSAADPLILSRQEHQISRKDIDRDALKALYRLIDHGHVTYLVGGAVRDLMLSRKPKDFDIVTDATPRKVKRLFRNCRIIGRRFRLAHLHYAEGKIIEVATFRSSGGADEVVREGELIRRDNVYGTPDEDAHRRDLTINGLFYDVSNFTVIDYVGGVSDLRSSVIRMIGDPHYSFKEDPIRMLRAIRHSVRIGFTFDQETRIAMEQSREEILKANPARLLEELYKDLCSGHAKNFFDVLYQQGFLHLLMPALFEVLNQQETKNDWIECLDRLDEQISAGHRVHQALGIAALVSPMLISRFRKLEATPQRDIRTISKIFREDLSEVLRQLKVYRRDEERLWAALGGLCAVADAVQRRKWSSKLKVQPWLCDSMEVLYVLLGPGDGRQEMLSEARKLPVQNSPEISTRRRRPRRRAAGNAGKQGVGGLSETRAEHNGVSEQAPSSRKRRRRRRKPTDTHKEKGPRRS